MPSSKVSLREMTDQEFKEWSAFSFENYVAESARAANQPPSAIRDKLGEPPGRRDDRDLWYVIEADGRWAGFFWIRLSPDRSEAFGFDIYIDKSFRGVGIGRKTMTAGGELLRSRGVKVLRVCVYGNNLVARALYESLGFQEKEFHAERNQYHLEIALTGGRPV